MDFEIETFVTHSLRAEGFDASEDGTGRSTPLVPVAFNSREDLTHSEEVFGSLGSSSPQAQAIAYAVHADTVGRTGEAKSMSPDAEGRMRLRDAGMGISEDASFSLTTGQPHVVAFAQNQRNEVRTMGIAGALAAEPGMKQQTYLAFDLRGREGGAQFEGPHDTANIRAASGGSSRSYVASTGVRRLMPVECERLQGFPDHFTAIPYRSRTVEVDEAQLAAVEGRAVWQDGDRLVTDCMADGPRYKALGNSMPVNVIRHYLQRVERQAA